MIYEVHRKVDNNVGDQFCNPSRYFSFDNLISGELVNNDFPVEDQIVIIGGGGLIHKKFQIHIQDMISKKPKKIVLWGIGHNFSKKYELKNDNDVYYPDWITHCSLVGIRDWIENYHNFYLPCVSCMHNAFDRNYDTKYDVVYFTHAFKSKINKDLNKIHMSNNEMNFYKVIEFLASGNTVVTDSYHGAYWAQLLGKNVQVVSWSVKFTHMKHKPVFLNSINDDVSLIKNSIDGFLEESRELNKLFYQKFLSL